MSNTQDNSTLKWIRGELDNTIKQARVELEDFIEGSGEKWLMSGCVKHLHQVSGTLQLVQLYGASMLAEEMELVAKGLADGTIRKQNEAADALMLGMVQLPEYLEKLEGGIRDLPLLVLPMLNELRATRDEDLLSEVALFAPDLEKRLASQAVEGEANPQLSEFTRGVRHKFHMVLLAWYRDSNSQSALQSLSAIFQSLEDQSGTEQVKRVFHIARGLSEGLRAGVLSAGVATKLLIGRIDRELKRIIDQGEQSVAESPAQDLIKNLLYYTASAEGGPPILDEIKAHYGLEGVLLSESELSRQRADMHASGQDLLNSLRTAIGDDLTAIKDKLDIYIRSQSTDLAPLQELETPISKLADTLGMVGQGGMRQRLKRQADEIAKLTAEGGLPDESILMSMASDILFIETSLENLATLGVHASTARALESTLPSGEFEKLIDAVMHEAAVDMAKNKEAVISYIEGPDQPQLLEDVPSRFESITGAFEILEMQDAADVVAGLSLFVVDRLHDSKHSSQPEELSAFAEALTAVEYFMEAVTEGRGIQPDILAISQEALRQLGIGESVEESGKAETTQAQEDDLLPELDIDFDLDLLGSGQMPDFDETPTSEFGVVLSMDETDEVIEDESDEIVLAEDSMPEMSVSDIPAMPESLPSAEKPALDEIDPEILDIFIEEAREELANIQEYLPRWQANQSDHEALAVFRRSFHTLKGSGRLVGASTIGEFAWSIEDLLNRVIDETIAIKPPLMKLLSDTLLVLPEMIDCQEYGGSPKADIQGMMDAALAIREGESATEYRAPEMLPSLNESEAIVTESVETVDPVDAALSLDEPLLEATDFESTTVDQTPEEDREPVDRVEEVLEPEAELPEAPIELDSTLLDIFGNESRTHIEVLKQFVTDCRQSPLGSRIDEAQTRALHTLHGSADMAGVTPIAKVSKALELLANDLLHHGHLADHSVADLLDQGVDSFEQVLSVINQPGGELPNWEGLEQVVESYRAGIQKTEPEPEVKAASAEAEYSPGDSGGDVISDLPLIVEEDIESTPEQSAEEKVVDSKSTQVDDSSATQSGVTTSQLQPEPKEALDVDPDLIEIFLEEALELLEALDSGMQRFVASPEDKEPIASLERTLHTLKGGARLSGVTPLGDLSHALESLLTAIASDRVESSPQVLDLARTTADYLAEQVDDLSEGPSVRGADRLVAQLDACLKGDLKEAFGAPAEEVEFISPDLEQPDTDDTETQKIEIVESTVEQEDESGEDEQSDEATGDIDESPPLPAGEELPSVVNIFSESELKVAEFSGDLEDVPVTDGEEPSPAVVPQDASADLSKSAPDIPVLSRAPVSTEENKDSDRRRASREHVRVRSDQLDKLVNNAGEVSIYRARLGQQNGSLGFNLNELEQTVDRLRGQLRNLEIETEAQILFRYERDQDEVEGPDETFDPLEMDRFSNIQQLSRSLLETVNDLANINEYLEDLQKETDTLLMQQSRVATDLQDGLMRIRMVPFTQLVPRLQRLVRQTCKSLGKQADLEIHGAGGEMDRGILERIVGPMEHLLRNAISHGIELPRKRKKANKPETGLIAIDITREGTDVVLTISDDGKGINVEEIRQRAIQMGMLDGNAEVTDSDVMQFVLEHGFSTADEVTQISGRGVGLDVVESEVKQLSGSLDISSRSGQGTTFIIRLPLTLAISDALLVEIGDEIYAIPHTSIEGVVRVSYEELTNCYEGRQEHYTYIDNDYQVRYLGHLLHTGQPNVSEQQKWFPMLLVRAGDHRVALHIDNVLGNRQVVVKSVGPQLGTVRWISGGTILGDGRVALILDLTALIRTDVVHTPAPEIATIEETNLEPGAGRLVMVVDDSITVRKVTGRLLERHGMHVITAKDGVDAVAQLQEQHPDIMLLDIEMPRMDGYELARHMRSSEDLSDIPIIMITSRSGKKHRNMAIDLGVKRYLGKPYQEADLLDNIYNVLAEIRS